MVWLLPTGKFESIRIAVDNPPAVPTVALPNVVLPMVNVTVPVGDVARGTLGVIVAVNMTDWPYTEGDGDEVTVVVVPSSTTSDIEPLLPRKLPSPP
jgi:hypothetical protein